MTTHLNSVFFTVYFPCVPLRKRDPPPHTVMKIANCHLNCLYHYFSTQKHHRCCKLLLTAVEVWRAMKTKMISSVSLIQWSHSYNKKGKIKDPHFLHVVLFQIKTSCHVLKEEESKTDWQVPARFSY